MEGVHLRVAGERKGVGVVGVDGGVWELMGGGGGRGGGGGGRRGGGGGGGGGEGGGKGVGNNLRLWYIQVMLLIAKRQRSCRTVYGCIYVDYQSSLWGTLLT